MAKIVIAGGTGFIGQSFGFDLIKHGHAVTVLGRDSGRIRSVFGGQVRPLLWSAPDNVSWVRELAEHDVVVNLAGAQAVGTRYSPANVEQIRDSRVALTRQLVDALGRARVRPRRLVSASAVGYYGPQVPGETCDESTPVGKGFLAELCHEWEEAALRAQPLGIEVVIARIGVVIGPGGGALSAMMRPFRLGMGGYLGNGRQDVSFISLADTVKALEYCVDGGQRLVGPVNVTAPEPVTAKQLAKAIGRALGKPSWLPVPAVALRALYGEGAEALLTGQRALPRKLESAHFEWQHPTIETAVESALPPT